MLIGVGSRRRSASQANDLPSDGGVNLGRLFTADLPRSLFHSQFDSIFSSIVSTECGEIQSSINPGISGDDTVSICTSST
jgi:hypothetical protein